MNLRRASVSGLSWSAVSETTSAILQVLQLFILARILDASDFGIFAIALTVVSLISIFADSGMNDAIIQRRSPTAQQLSSLYWFNLGVGVVLFLVVMLAANRVSGLFEDDRVALLLMLCAVPIVVGAIGHQFGLLLQRQLRFRDLAAVELAAAILGTVSTIVAAITGAGVYALVAGQLVGSVVSTLCLVFLGRKHWWPSLHFDRKDLKGYLDFGAFMMAQRVVETVANQIDKFLVGAFLGTDVLGAYYLALRIAELPLQRFMAVSMRVLLPVMSIVQNEIEALKRGYLLSARGLAIVGFPLSLGVVATAEWLVPVMFGSGWQLAVFPLQVLTLANIFVFINIPGHALVLARGHARLKFMWSLQISSMRLIAVLLGLWAGGLFGLVIAILLFRVMAVWPFYRLMVRSQLGPVFGEIARSIFPAALATGAMTLAVLWVMAMLQDATIAHLSAVVAFGVLLYAALILLFLGKELREIWKSIVERP